jgi:hypothetical protein
MLADVMRSCLVIMEDILDTLPVLLYQVITPFVLDSPLVHFCCLLFNHVCFLQAGSLALQLTPSSS